MKVLLSLCIALAISGGFVSSQLTTAEFEEQIQDFRSRLNGIHKLMDYHLRDSRWNVSELFQDWNRELLSHHAIYTTDIQNLRYEVYNEILDRVGELGNQNECLIGIDSSLTAATIAANENAKQCAQTAYNLVSGNFSEEYFYLLNFLQRESTFAQHLQFYGMGRYNVITYQQGVLDFLEPLWDEVETGWPTIWIPMLDEEEYKLNLHRISGIAYSNACIEIMFSGYSTAVNIIRGDLADCA